MNHHSPNPFQRLWRSNFFIRLRSWEYWPFGIIQLPFFAYWLWLSAKARSLVFFSAANPSIFMGGMFGESKMELLSSIPAPYVARSAIIGHPYTPGAVTKKMQELNIRFPVILKPDLGERGWMVKKVTSEGEVSGYAAELGLPFIVQEWVDLPLEFGVFFRRYPMETKGSVTSVVMKEMLSITGDGFRSVHELIMALDRAKLQYEKLAARMGHEMQRIPAKGEKIELVSIGNHCLGTKFIDATHLINDKLDASFNLISNQIPGFFFGRYDLRAASVQDLEDGKVKIMELNGCGAEPAHIYHPGFSLWEAMKVMHRHWSDLFRISVENHRRGVPYVSLREGIKAYKKFKNHVRA